MLIFYYPLSLEWFNLQDNSSETLLFLQTLLKCSTHLERLLLHDLCGKSRFNFRQSCSILEDPLVHFALEMKNLVALCLAGLRFDSAVAAKVRERVVNEILPLRPSFWFYLDYDLPEGNDPTVPRIHYDEIVNPPIWLLGFPPSF